MKLIKIYLEFIKFVGNAKELNYQAYNNINSSSGIMVTCKGQHMKKLDSSAEPYIKSIFLVTSIAPMKPEKIEKITEKLRNFWKNYTEANKAFICAHCHGA